MPDLEPLLKAIVDSSPYLTLATADEEGRPWASPVWFATADYREFFWVSAPEARHSRNIAARPDVAIVIFDSRQPPGTGQGAYMEATAEQVPEPELDGGLSIYASVSEAQALPRWTRAEVESPAKHRLYRAFARNHFVLSSRDERLPVELA